MTNQTWWIGGSGSRECLKRLSRWLACPQYETQRLEAESAAGASRMLPVTVTWTTCRLLSLVLRRRPPSPPVSPRIPSPDPHGQRTKPLRLHPFFEFALAGRFSFTVAGPLLCT